MIHIELMKLVNAFLRTSQEGSGVSLMRSWTNSVVISSFQNLAMVSLTVLFSSVVKPLSAKRKSGHAGSRGATQKVKLTEAQIRRWRRIW